MLGRTYTHVSSYNMENGWVKEQNVLHSFLRDYTEFKVLKST